MAKNNWMKELVNTSRFPTDRLTSLIDFVNQHFEELNEHCSKQHAYRLDIRDHKQSSCVSGWFRAMDKEIRINIGLDLKTDQYPTTHIYKARAGMVTCTSFEEEFVQVLSHELQHTDQWRRIRVGLGRVKGSKEVDAELKGIFVLKRYRQAMGIAEPKHDVQTVQGLGTESYDTVRRLKGTTTPVDDPRWDRAKKKGLKECPKCSIEKDIELAFGYRIIKGWPEPQSYCRDCRKAKPKK